MKSILRFFKLGYWNRRFLLSKYSNFIFKKNQYRKKIFNSIYSSNHWRNYKNPENNESKSGFGSDLKDIQIFINEFKKFISKNKISSILDVGCGDYVYMNEVLKNTNHEIKYTGVDIVPSIISSNKKKYTNKNVRFKVLDAVEENVEGNYDLILSRFVMIHLDNEDNQKFLSNLKKIDYKFIALTSTPSLIANYDLKKTGKYRDINLEIEPYNYTKKTFSITDIKDLKKNQDLLLFYKKNDF